MVFDEKNNGFWSILQKIVKSRFFRELVDGMLLLAFKRDDLITVIYPGTMMRKFKKIINRNIIPLLGLPFRNRKLIPVVYYHNVVPDGEGCSFRKTDIAVFSRHMSYLAENGYNTYTFAEIPEQFNKDIGDKEVVITFDDGFLSNYSIAYPLMKELGLKFNIFIAAQKVEENFTDYLTWEMVKEMSASDMVGFGAHTYSHIDARKINDRNYEKEVTHTNVLIKKHSGRQVEDFCFPCGYYNQEILRKFCQREAYKRLYTSDYMKLKQLENCEMIGRIPISNDHDLVDFINGLERLHDIIYYYKCFKKRRDP